MPAPHVPSAIATMPQALGVEIPESKFRRRLLNRELLHKGVAPGRIAFLFAELDSANLLVDDRHHSTTKAIT
jgi:hypothetical protein